MCIYTFLTDKNKRIPIVINQNIRDTLRKDLYTLVNLTIKDSSNVKDK